MYIHYQFAPRSGGRMTWVCCVSQTRVMLRAIALVILPSFQSGLHPDDGHALQSSLDLRPKWRVLPWRRWWHVCTFKANFLRSQGNMQALVVRRSFVWQSETKLCSCLLRARATWQNLEFMLRYIIFIIIYALARQINHNMNYPSISIKEMQHINKFRNTAFICSRKR